MRSAAFISHKSCQISNTFLCHLTTKQTKQEKRREEKKQKGTALALGKLPTTLICSPTYDRSGLTNSDPAWRQMLQWFMLWLWLFPPLPFTVSRHHRRHPQGPVLQSTCWKHPLEFSSFYPASTTTSANVSTNVLSLRVRSCPCRTFLVLKHRNHNSHLTVSWLIFWVVSFFGFWFFGLVLFYSFLFATCRFGFGSHALLITIICSANLYGCMLKIWVNSFLFCNVLSLGRFT